MAAPMPAFSAAVPWTKRGAAVVQALVATGAGDDTSGLAATVGVGASGVASTATCGVWPSGDRTRRSCSTGTSYRPNACPSSTSTPRTTTSQIRLTARDIGHYFTRLSSPVPFAMSSNRPGVGRAINGKASPYARSTPNVGERTADVDAKSVLSFQV